MNNPLIRKAMKVRKTKPPFKIWYANVPKEKSDTTYYNLRRAYELAPQKELDEFISNPKAHLRSMYFNKEGVGEFVKHKDHPTTQKELDWYKSDASKDFRKLYRLDTSGDYYKYVPRNK